MRLWDRLVRPRKRNPPGHQDTGGHLNAVDRNGERYTTHTFATRDDWWWGAHILTPVVVDQLRRDGLLPLTEVHLDGTVAAR
jgi:hypothetical protein